MITIEKLLTLPRKTRLRKIITIIQDMEYRAAQNLQVDTVYLQKLLLHLQQETTLPAWLMEKLSRSRESLPETLDNRMDPHMIRRLCNDIRAGLQQYFGIEPADWDFTDFSTGKLAGDKRIIFPFSIFLEDLRSPFNVGSIFRSAESFGVQQIYLTPSVPTPEHKRVKRTAMGCTEIIPWEQREIEYAKTLQNVFVLELGGTPIHTFPFPKEGTVIIGSEELGISPEAAGIAASGYGRVSIPTCGAKGSLNVSVAFGILMHFWFNSVQT